MFNIGFGEMAIICIVLIIAVGPERLPTMMKTLGKTLRTLRQASRDIRASTGIDELMREDFDIYTPPPRRPAIAPPPAVAPVALPDPVVTPATEASTAEGEHLIGAGSPAQTAAPAAPVPPKPVSREDFIDEPVQPVVPAAPVPVPALANEPKQPDGPSESGDTGPGAPHSGQGKGES
jgi:sec-independent protein translocase protein TatB